MENKKSILNKKINENELIAYSKGIMLKALKVMEAKGNKIASEIIEGKRKDIKEDLLQEIALKIIENNYTITKECFACVNNYIYNIKKDTIVLNILDSEKQEDVDLIDKKAYCEYISAYNEKEKSGVFNIEELGLTSRQMEILNIYAKGFSMSKVAEILGVSKSTVSNTIYRIKDSLQYLKVC